LLALLGPRRILHVSRIRVKGNEGQDKNSSLHSVTAENNHALKYYNIVFPGASEQLLAGFCFSRGMGVLESTPAKSAGLAYRKTFTFTPTFCDLKIKDHKMELY
jgi:hypothetical protein